MPNPQITDGVNTVEFLAILRGAVNIPGIMLEDISQPGVDGHAFIDGGIRGEFFELVTMVDLDDPATQAIEKILYGGFMGSLTTVTDQLLNAYNNILIRRVAPIREVILFTPVGGISNNAGTALWARWLMQNTSTDF